MKSSRTVIPVVLATVAGYLAMLVIATPLHAQNQALLGKWNMTSTAPENEVPWTLTIAYKDGKYEAVSSTDDGSTPAKDFRVDGNVVHFSVDYQGAAYDIDLTLKGDLLTGTWSGRGDAGETKGRKA